MVGRFLSPIPKSPLSLLHTIFGDRPFPPWLWVLQVAEIRLHVRVSAQRLSCVPGVIPPDPVAAAIDRGTPPIISLPSLLESPRNRNPFLFFWPCFVSDCYKIPDFLILSVLSETLS